MIRKRLRYRQLATGYTKHSYVDDDDFCLRVPSTYCLYIDQFRLTSMSAEQIKHRMLRKSISNALHMAPSNIFEEAEILINTN